MFEGFVMVVVCNVRFKKKIGVVLKKNHFLIFRKKKSFKMSFFFNLI